MCLRVSIAIAACVCVRALYHRFAIFSTGRVLTARAYQVECWFLPAAKCENYYTKTRYVECTIFRWNCIWIYLKSILDQRKSKSSSFDVDIRLFRTRIFQRKNYENETSTSTSIVRLLGNNEKKRNIKNINCMQNADKKKCCKNFNCRNKKCRYGVRTYSIYIFACELLCEHWTVNTIVYVHVQTSCRVIGMELLLLLVAWSDVECTTNCTMGARSGKRTSEGKERENKITYVAIVIIYLFVFSSGRILYCSSIRYTLHISFMLASNKLSHIIICI